MADAPAPTTLARWGLVSTARVNRHIVAAAKSSAAARIVAVASRSADTAATYAAANGIEASFASYDAMLDVANTAVDCVYVSLPNDAHVDIVLRAAEGKKHILCEKPMALKATEVASMFDAAERNGVVLLEGFMNLHSALVHKARELLRGGAIGNIVSMSGVFSYTETRGGFRRTATSAQGGGALWDVGSYLTALARFLVGREPTAVHCVQSRLAQDNEGDASAAAAAVAGAAGWADETSAGTLIFSGASKSTSTAAAALPTDGAITCQFVASFALPLNMGFTVMGTAGTLHLRNPFKPDPTKAEEIVLQHDLAEPPVVITASGVGAAGTPAGHLYQAELDCVSRAALARDRDRRGGGGGGADAPATTGSSSSKHCEMTMPLSRAFSIGNAAVIEALHRSATTGQVEAVVVPA